MINVTRTVSLAFTVLTLCIWGFSSSHGQRLTAKQASTASKAVATLDRVGAFVVQCGRSYGQELWIVQNGVHRLVQVSGGVSEMSVNASGTVVYAAAAGTVLSDLHVLTPTKSSPSTIGGGTAPAVADDGRIAFVRTKQTRPLRDDVYVSDGKHIKKVASFPLVWNLFWRRERLAAMIGPGRTHLIWDVKHPGERLTLPGRGGRTIQVEPDRGLVAAQLSRGHDSYDIGIASRSQHHFRRVAKRLYPLAWSPDGRFVLGSDFAPSTQLSIVDVRRHITTRVGSLPCGRVVQAAWLPRGTKLPPIPAR